MGAIINMNDDQDRDAWSTPRLLFSRLNDEFKFDLDVAAYPENAKCERYFTQENSAFKNVWGPNASAWCNPPYSKIDPWLSMAIHASKKWETSTVFLIPANIDTIWFHDLVLPNFEFWLFRGRVNFRPPSGVLDSKSPGFGVMLCRCGPGVEPGFKGSRCPRTGRVLKNVRTLAAAGN